MARRLLSSLLALAAAASCVDALLPDEKWGFVDVRPGAHMFWWLYGSTGASRATAPIVMWLQGGPVSSFTACALGFTTCAQYV